MAILRIKYILLMNRTEKANVKSSATHSFCLILQITIVTHHVIGILSGVGEKIIISLYHLPVLLLLLQLLELLQLPASLRALQLQLGKQTSSI